MQEESAADSSIEYSYVYLSQFLLAADMEPTSTVSPRLSGQLVAQLGLKTDCGYNFHSIIFAETNIVK